jgi:hypothetical protein
MARIIPNTSWESAVIIFPCDGSGRWRVRRDPDAVTICCSFVPANWPRMAWVTAVGGCRVKLYMNIEDVVAMILQQRRKPAQLEEYTGLIPRSVRSSLRSVWLGTSFSASSPKFKFALALNQRWFQPKYMTDKHTTILARNLVRTWKCAPQPHIPARDVGKPSEAHRERSPNSQRCLFDRLSVEEVS